MNDEEVLNKAIELLRLGWIQGRSYKVLRGPWPWQKRYLYCATGAIDAAITGASHRDYIQSIRLCNLLDSKTWEVTNEECSSVARYNDVFAENVENVITILEKVKADLS